MRSTEKTSDGADGPKLDCQMKVRHCTSRQSSRPLWRRSGPIGLPPILWGGFVLPVKWGDTDARTPTSCGRQVPVFYIIIMIEG